MSTSIAATAPALAIPSNLPNMSFSNCSSFPPVNDSSRSAAWWNETVYYPLGVCSSGNISYVAPCCAYVGGEAREACGRVMCLTDQMEGYKDCTEQVRKEHNDSKSMAYICMVTRPGNTTSADEESAARPAYVRPVCAALAMSMLAAAAAAL